MINNNEYLYYYNNGRKYRKYNRTTRLQNILSLQYFSNIKL